MKKIIILTASITFATSVQAVSWSTFSSFFKEDVKSKSFNVEASGYDIRAYEWPCRWNPEMMCFFGASSSGGLGGGSYPIKKELIEKMKEAYDLND